MRKPVIFVKMMFDGETISEHENWYVAGDEDIKRYCAENMCCSKCDNFIPSSNNDGGLCKLKSRFEPKDAYCSQFVRKQENEE